MRWHEENGLSLLGAELPGARVAFTTRGGGVSERPYESLNLGIATGDRPSAVVENRRRVCEALGVEPSRVCMARQVHGADLATWEGSPEPPVWELGVPAPLEADGHVVRTPGPVLSVLVADCLPVALVGPDGLALLHCGWRGLAAGIVDRGAEAVGGATHAAVGPGIGPEAYEVGAEVLEAFEHLGPGIGTEGTLDLADVCTRLLTGAGVGTIETAGTCTHSSPDRFFSHRRDGPATGRQAALAWLTA